MRGNNKQIETKNFLDRQRKAKGNEALFVALDKDTGEFFENNVYDDEWRVASSKNASVALVMIHKLDESELSLEEQEDVRIAAAAALSEGRDTGAILRCVYQVPLMGLGLDDVLLAFDEAIRSYKIALKALFKYLAQTNREKYAAVREELKKHPIPEPKVNAWDVRNGTLSRSEMLDIATKMNDWSKTVLNRKKFSQWLSDKGVSRITHFVKLQQFIVMRFATLFHLRPTQIRLLSWSHFKTEDGVMGPFLFDGEGYFSPPSDDGSSFNPRYIKQRDDSPERMAAPPKPVTAEFAKELLLYVERIAEILKECAQSAGIELSMEEVIEQVLKLPVIMKFTIQDEFKSHDTKQSLFQAIDKDSWLNDGNQINTYITAQGKQLRFESDRLPQSEYSISTTRLRHYSGTTIKLRGGSDEEIAEALTQTSTQAAKKYYVDMPADAQAQMDNNRVDADFLVAAASGNFADQLKSQVTDSIDENEEVIESMEAGNLGKSAAAPMCRGCSLTKPVACYGCSFFKPLANGNHRQQLAVLTAEYEAKKLAGFTGNQIAMYEQQIRKIQLTIIVCDNALKLLPDTQGGLGK
ncbi:hypothetical protein N9L54_05240 [Porticoccaceae bacterium]|nr:hypothetical protein [Porticoccaceae bacterium]